MAWQVSALVVVLGSLCVSQSAARSLDADEPCAADAQRVDFADVTFCIPRSNARYQSRVDGFMGLQFWPQAFLGDHRVSPERYYDANGDAPPDGTYVYIRIRQPINGGRIDAERQVRLLRDLNDAFRNRADDQTFTEQIGGRTFDFERLSLSTVVGMSAPRSLDEQTRQIWVRLDVTEQIHHTMICDYSESANSMITCESQFLVGNSSARILLFGGTPTRSFRISEEIRADIESFIVSRSSP
jgi:hypothetical protein